MPQAPASVHTGAVQCLMQSVGDLVEDVLGQRRASVHGAPDDIIDVGVLRRQGVRIIFQVWHLHDIDALCDPALDQIGAIGGGVLLAAGALLRFGEPDAGLGVGGCHLWVLFLRGGAGVAAEV